MARHNLITTQITANSTAQLLNPASIQGSRGDIEVTITVTGANTVFFGGVSTVTTANGMPVTNTMPAKITTSANIYVLTTGTSTIGASFSY